MAESVDVSSTVGSVGATRLDDIEAELAQATPFAGFDYLSQNTVAEYARFLSLVAPRLPSAASLSIAVEGRHEGAHLLQDPSSAARSKTLCSPSRVA